MTLASVVETNGGVTRDDTQYKDARSRKNPVRGCVNAV